MNNKQFYDNYRFNSTQKSLQTQIFASIIVWVDSWLLEVSFLLIRASEWFSPNQFSLLKQFGVETEPLSH